MALRWTPTSTGDFSYSLGFTGAYNQNKVISTRDWAVFFAGNLPLGDYRTTISRVGAPVGAFRSTATRPPACFRLPRK